MVKRGVESMWNIQNNRVMMALAMTMSDKPMAVNMSFQREYAEPYEWMKQQFIDLAFTFLTSVIFYEDYDDMTPDQRLLMQEGMTAFGGIAPLTGLHCLTSQRLSEISTPLCLGFR